MSLSYVQQPFKPEEIDALLNEIVKKWFYSNFKSYSLPQLYAVPLIAKRQNVLVSAPTGATKTLTAFLSILNELVWLGERGQLKDKVYCVYISPLKALNRDIAVNLLGPLKEMEKIAGKRLGIRVAVRTGDTKTEERQKMLKLPPHILITTPETVAILLSAKRFRLLLQQVEWVVVDELHALADNKRGVHLTLSLERLQALSPDLVRIGLSATIAPLEEVARFLVGIGRRCAIVDVQAIKEYDLAVVLPTRGLQNVPFALAHSSMYKLLDELIQSHRTTLIFTNTRSGTERVVDNLKERFGSRYNSSSISAHHGSLGRELRFSTEESLRQGLLKAVVSSTSLELGIDIGYIDLVVCLGSPKSVARFLQRAGRSGHKLHDRVKGRIIVLDRDDLIECCILAKAALEKKIDRISIPKNALDVLAQHIVGMALERSWDSRELFELVRRSYCYSSLAWSDFDQVLSYLAGEYVELEDRRVYAKIWKRDGAIGRRGKLTGAIYMSNIGTIPSESYVVVKSGDRVLGLLDEDFVDRLKPGDTFLLGGEIYEFKYARGLTVQVSANCKRPPTVPSWFSEMLPLSFDLALEIGKFKRLVFEKFRFGKSDKEIIQFIQASLGCSEDVAQELFAYAKEQWLYCRKIPNDKLIVVEHTFDGRQKKVVFHSGFGRRVNDCLSRAIGFAISKLQHRDVEIGINDNGFYIGGKFSIEEALSQLTPENLRKVLEAAIERTEVLKRRFRHCAERALALLRKYAGKEKSVGRQHQHAGFLLSALKRFNPDFFLIREAKRECLEELMDIENAIKVLKGIKDGSIELHTIHTAFPSPFAFNIAFQGYLDVLKVEDRWEFLKAAHERILKEIGDR